ncbi:PepSY-associated TM helix domain-containing protein [Atlantibacter hermannii]|uniref:PepSY-associated TM helix domain-containing protein n=1 Tax=Atlantibacter hermannii TaxID=565 RepID=UPI00289C13E8|nr:PepSY-associated TM helix domain-containing protein [Atlantibacter hermannii]
MTTCTQRQAWITLLRRLHFAIGLFVGPFIFVAALSGTLYVATPQLEQYVYASTLNGSREGEPQPLARQIDIANQVTQHALRLHAVRPGLEAGQTTRVMYSDPALAPSEHRAIFIDPVTLAVTGDMTVYGTSGILPLRQWIDYLHRSLLLGDVGRLYSELAASWMWIAALGGIFLWWMTKPSRKPRTVKRSRLMAARQLHITLGLTLLAGLLLFSATGLTWSQYAGGNVDKLRAAMGWMTPQVNTLLSGQAVPADPHAEHHGHHPAATEPQQEQGANIDRVLALAQHHGIHASLLEIRPPRNPHQAWTVKEIDRRWPTQVDAVAINGETMQVIDQTSFEQFPLMAKLTRWGVDFHMGILFGLINQLALIGFGIALCVLIGMGYRQWWLRRPAAAVNNPAETPCQAWLMLSGVGRTCAVIVIAAFGFAMPVLGISLLLFLLFDIFRWKRAQRRQAAQPAVN